MHLNDVQFKGVFQTMKINDFSKDLAQFVIVEKSPV